MADCYGSTEVTALQNIYLYTFIRQFGQTQCAVHVIKRFCEASYHYLSSLIRVYSVSMSLIWQHVAA